MTSLLPVREGEFAEKSYWEKFFRQRGEQAFEWYGDYTSNVELYMKYVRPTDSILVVGCGNSELSVHLYDLQRCHNICNVDISATVIRQMQSKHSPRRPGLDYLVADVCQLDSDPQLQLDGVPRRFSVVIDKGTLDAMHSTTDTAALEAVGKMLQQITNCLTKAGRYLCITLAQEHIVDTLLDLASKQPGWIVRCHRLTETAPGAGDSSGFALPVFAFVFTKMFDSTTGNTPSFPTLFEVATSVQAKLDRVSSAAAMKNWISTQQSRSLVLHSMRSNSDSSSSGPSSVQFAVVHPSSNDVMFLCHLLHATPTVPSATNKKNKKQQVQKDQFSAPYAVFVVPFGREDTFDSVATRHQLLEQVRVSRLLVVSLNPRLGYITSRRDMETLLNDTALAYAPTDLPPAFRINYLSTPDEVVWKEVTSMEQSNTRFCLQKCSALGHRVVLRRGSEDGAPPHTCLNSDLKGTAEEVAYCVVKAVCRLRPDVASSCGFLTVPSTVKLWGPFETVRLSIGGGVEDSSDRFCREIVAKAAVKCHVTPLYPLANEERFAFLFDHIRGSPEDQWGSRIESLMKDDGLCCVVCEGDVTTLQRALPTGCEVQLLASLARRHSWFEQQDGAVCLVGRNVDSMASVVRAVNAEWRALNPQNEAEVAQLQDDFPFLKVS